MYKTKTRLEDLDSCHSLCVLEQQWNVIGPALRPTAAFVQVNPLNPNCLSVTKAFTVGLLLSDSDAMRVCVRVCVCVCVHVHSGGGK